MKIKNLKIIILLSSLFISVNSEADSLNHEAFYQARWCAEHNGLLEQVLKDGSRVDCLTQEYAIEFDFADKHHEALGQALLYSNMTQRLPGVVLIMENVEKDYKYLIRLLIASQNIDGFRIWIITK